MNLVYCIMVVVSLVWIAVVSPESALPVMLSGANNAIRLAMTLAAIYAIWMSVLDLMEKIGLNRLIHKLMLPITRKLFRGESEQALQSISMNFSANLLGMGGAATPLGIRAMEAMQDGSETATDNMILFMVINCTSIQLLPATVIGLRSAAGSATASDILLPSLIATTVTTFIGVLTAKVCAAFSRRSKKRAPQTAPSALPLATRHAIGEQKR